MVSLPPYTRVRREDRVFRRAIVRLDEARWARGPLAVL